MKALRWSISVQRSHREDPIITPLGPLDVKIGLHVGAPLPNPHDHDDFIGQEMDLAARLCDGASRGQVLISEPAAALIRAASLSDVSIHPHGFRELKGFGNVPVFELLGGNAVPDTTSMRRGLTEQPPVAPATFIGRDVLLQAIHSRLRQGGVTVLKGEGGMERPHWPSRPHPKPSRPTSCPAGQSGSIASSNPAWTNVCARWHACFSATEWSKSRSTVAASENRASGTWRCAVVFDNFETVAHDARLIRWLAALRPPARILVTTAPSRQERSGRLCQSMSCGSTRPATSSFSTRAGPARYWTGKKWRLTRFATPWVVNHALELLAARAARWSRWAGCSSACIRARTSLPPHRTQLDPAEVAAPRLCIELSFKDLSESARELLARLSVFADGAGPAVITAVTGTEAWDLGAEELVAASVWRLSGRRYTMHPLVRQIALEQLVTNRAECELRAARGLTNFICARGEEARRHAADPARSRGPSIGARPSCPTWLPPPISHLPPKTGPRSPGSRTAPLHVFQIRGHWSDAERLYALSLAATRHSGDRTGEATALNQLGWVYRQQGRWTEAESAHRESLSLWQAIGDRRGEGNTLKHLGRMFQLRGRLDESSAVCEQALALLRTAGDSVGEAKTLAYLANIHRFQQRWDVAVEVYQEALAISRRIGDLYDEGEILRHLGQIYHHQVLYDQAKQRYNEA